MGNDCFKFCLNLTSISFPESLTSLGNDCFSYCNSLTSITLPEGLNFIGASCFYGDARFTTIYCRATTPPYVGTTAFPAELSKIYVPYAAVEEYKASSSWSELADRIYPFVESISFDEAEVSIERNQTKELSVNVLPSTADTESLTWESSDPSVVSVDTKGSVKAVKVGTATITISTTDGTDLTCIIHRAT